MKVIRHREVRQFRDRAGPWLAEAEAENHLILGISADLASRPESAEAESYLITIENETGTGIAGAALMTPPRELIVTRAPPAAIRLLAQYLLETGAPVSGALGPSAAADDFARCWAEKTGSPPRPGMSLRIYQCARVVLPACGPGCLRAATAKELPLLAAWRGELYREVGLGDQEDHLASVQNSVADRRLYVWDHGRTVSMAAWAGETVRGVRIGLVYTPPECRGRGYATSCVAALTQLLLDSGRKYCFLAADRGNPTSNRIYRRIGYRPVCDSQTWRFD